MKILATLVSFLVIAGCVPGDCVKDCYLVEWRNQDREHKCDMDPYLHDCPVKP